MRRSLVTYLPQVKALCTPAYQQQGVAYATHCLPSLTTRELHDTLVQPFGRSSRYYGRVAEMESKEHMTARLAYQAALRELRSKWRIDNLKAQVKKAENDLQRTQKIQARKAKRVAAKVVHRQKKAARAAEAAERSEAAKEAKAEEGARWRNALRQIYINFQQTRKTQLLHDSKNWIRTEDLDERINEALNNPVKLYQ